MSFIENLGQQMGTGLAGTIFGLTMENHNDNRQLQQQTELQNLQIRGQKELTDYNMQKQLEMWKNTSYGAQMEQLKKAGLNPALIYGMGGGGGQTTGNSSSSVSGATAQQNPGEVQQMIGIFLLLLLLFRYLGYSHLGC